MSAIEFFPQAIMMNIKIIIKSKFIFIEPTILQMSIILSEEQEYCEI
jgi:hypothetical protein